MRIVSFGDIHMSTSKAQLINDIKTSNLLLVTGDLTNFGRVADANQVINDLLKINSNLIAQVGNLDHYEINDYLENLGYNIHGHARIVEETICIAGTGGSNKTPFSTPTEFTEEELYSTAKRAMTHALDLISTVEKSTSTKIPLIFASHTPPYATSIDKLVNNSHVGSTAIRKIIEEFQPDLCVTGHIHEATGTDIIGKTPIINPGMLSNGGWIEIIINNESITATLEQV